MGQSMLQAAEPEGSKNSLDGLHPDSVVRHVEVVEDVAGVVFVEHAVDVQQASQDIPWSLEGKMRHPRINWDSLQPP